MPPVTIGLPVYNAERYLRQSIESLLNQTFSDFVLIISDNASTDDSGEICQEYARRDSRVQYHRNERNIGVAANFNRLFHLADSPYLKWSTADDYWAETMLERAFEIMEADHSIAACYPKCVLVDAEGKKLRCYDDDMHLMSDSPAERVIQLLQNVGLCHQLLGLTRTDCLRRTLLYGVYAGADLDLIIDLALYGKFYEIPERLFFRRLHQDSSSWAKDEDHQKRRYHSTESARIVLTTWRHHLRRLRAVMRSPIAASEKRRLYKVFARSLLWDRGELAREIRARVTTR